MRHLIFRLFLISLAWIMLLSYVFPWPSYDIEVPFSGSEYKLGLDLQWWIELDYRVDLTEAKTDPDYDKETEKEIIEGLKSIIDKRIETLNISDSVITTASYAGEQHIIVQVPLKWNDSLENSENIEKAKAAIWKVVQIEFKERNPEFSYSSSWITVWGEEWMRAFDSEWRYLSDKYFVKSSVQFNEAFTPMVELTFNSDWAKIFWELSTRLVGQQMAIFVGWELLTAPNINEPILWGKAVITWNYTPEEARLLAQDINTWVVPAPIFLTSEKTIDSKLWVSSLEKLIFAWISWFLLILVFLVIVYRLAWLMSAVALLSYVAIVLTVIKWLWVVLTLASIAWLILSVGMAIDANILIFERIKDELKSWKDLKEATVTWFKKSWSAIWDSNVTWFIVALILFIFGINMIKGFWLMLAIWIIVSLFSAMWISRILLVLLADTIKSENAFIWFKK